MDRILERSLGTFVYSVLLMRIVGRKSVAQLNYLDLLMVNIAGGIMGYYIASESQGMKLLSAPAALVAATVVTELGAMKSKHFRNFVEGYPIMIIKNGKILRKNLGKTRYNLDELLTYLREKSIFNPSQVEFALLEFNGKISVQLKSQYRPVTPKDLNLSTQYEGLSSVLISDGVILEDHLNKNKLGLDWLKAELQKLGVFDLSKVFLASLATDGTLYVDVKR